MHPSNDMIQKFLRHSIDGYSAKEWVIEPAGAAASARTFLRIRAMSANRKSLILILWNADDPEWNRFISIGNECRSVTDVLPRRHAVDEEAGLILEEDLGEVTLRRFCENEKNGENTVCEWYVRVLEQLASWHEMPLRHVPAVAAVTMDAEAYLWESDYFVRHCVDAFCARKDIIDESWERERREVAERAAAEELVCMHRDFQSENILLQDGRIRFVDFQGARRGAASYDVASLLYDPYIMRLSDSMREKLLCGYLSRNRNVTRSGFSACAAQRLMQACGAYANLARNRGKPHYARYLPTALQRLFSLLNDFAAWPAMTAVARECADICCTITEPV